MLYSNFNVALLPELKKWRYNKARQLRNRKEGAVASPSKDSFPTTKHPLVAESSAAHRSSIDTLGSARSESIRGLLWSDHDTVGQQTSIHHQLEGESGDRVASVPKLPLGSQLSRVGNSVLAGPSGSVSARSAPKHSRSVTWLPGTHSQVIKTGSVITIVDSAIQTKPKKPKQMEKPKETFDPELDESDAVLVTRLFQLGHTQLHGRLLLEEELLRERSLHEQELKRKVAEAYQQGLATSQADKRHWLRLCWYWSLKQIGRSHRRKKAYEVSLIIAVRCSGT